MINQGNLYVLFTKRTNICHHSSQHYCNKLWYYVIPLTTWCKITQPYKQIKVGVCDCKMIYTFTYVWIWSFLHSQNCPLQSITLQRRIVAFNAVLSNCFDHYAKKYSTESYFVCMSFAREVCVDLEKNSMSCLITLFVETHIYLTGSTAYNVIRI